MIQDQSLFWAIREKTSHGSLPELYYTIRKLIKSSGNYILLLQSCSPPCILFLMINNYLLVLVEYPHPPVPRKEVQNQCEEK